MSEQWRRAGKITIPTGKFPAMYLSCPGYRQRREEAQNAGVKILPYRIAFFELRCMVSAIVASQPDCDFRVVYITRGNTKRTFERKDGATLPGSDQRLETTPNPLVSRLCAFRAIPVDLDTFNP